MEEAIVKVEHLSHRYSVQWAVKDISFEIPKRGIYGLLGSNGAGKSTVMNIICGVLKQTCLFMVRIRVWNLWRRRNISGSCLSKHPCTRT